MTVTDPLDFATAWVAAWNRHDVDAVLAHFHDDVVFPWTSASYTNILLDGHGRRGLSDCLSIRIIQM